jgi:hypothetical protein
MPHLRVARPNNRWSAAQVAEEKAKILEGGYLKASWARDTSLLASADNFVFLVEGSDRREIKRVKPAPSIAQPFSFMSVTVFSLMPLSERLPDGAKVFVIEASVRRRFDYLIKIQASRKNNDNKQNVDNSQCLNVSNLPHKI